ncbi:GtrA family protein [Clostridium malenominatum]|uniref:GtrA family protein n=1 Tax=Clostridium malenominatum TaxID=1539 RepID=A0ABN1J314_9CLOT
MKTTNFIKSIIKKKCSREIVTYTIFGVLTMFVGIFIYQGLLFFNISYKTANLISLILGKLFAYITNKVIVFRSKKSNIYQLFNEFIRFILTRGFTGILDYFGLIYMVEFLGINKVVSKYLLQIIVIILNYVFGKLVVFKKS